MPSAAQKGARWKARTRRWLEANGYQVVDLEVVRWVHKPDGTRFPVKRDQMASDLMGVSAAGIVFIQVKGGKQAAGAGTFPEARRKFAACVFPPSARRCVVAWAPRARHPRIVDCTHDVPVVQEALF